MAQLEINIKIVVTDFEWAEPLTLNGVEKHVNTAIAQGGCGFSSAIWQMGSFADLEVTKLELTKSEI